MSVLDKNKIFFGLIHYVFSEQNNVDWAFKTSLVNFTGINTSIDTKKTKKVDLTDSIIDYIYNVKPYHVQFEQYIEKYSSQQDDVDIDIIEQNNITVNMRFDAITSDIDDQNGMTDLEYMDTHMANRLYLTTTKDQDIIKDYLNCHFKGISVDSTVFNIDKSGYDAFLYDSNLYDAPTISNTYCLVDMYENRNVNTDEELRLKQTNFVKVGTSSYQLNTNIPITKDDLIIKSIYNGKIEDIEDFSLENNIVTLFYETRAYEKIKFQYRNDLDNIFYETYVSHPFTESNDESDIRQFVDIYTNRFPLPKNYLQSGKLVVQISDTTGSIKPYTNYIIENGEVVLWVDDRIVENAKIILSIIDYSYIYDKIYNWEDVYGQSYNFTSVDRYYDNMGNFKNLDGNNLLRPHYESERPSELVVSQPYTYLMIHQKNNSDKSTNIFNIDYKNTHFDVPLALNTVLKSDFKEGDKEIDVENGSILYLPYKKDGEIIPGKIIINNEIIAFYDYKPEPDGSYKLKQIRRGFGGSFIKENHYKGDIVYVYVDKSENYHKVNNTSLSYEYKQNDENKFIIPMEFNNDEKIEVWKKPVIKLLTDITYSSEYFEINSNNIKLPSSIMMTTPSNTDFVIYKGQTLCIEIDEKPYSINIEQTYTDIKEFVEFLQSKLNKFTSSVKMIYNEDTNNFTIITPNAQPIRLYNKKGYVVQDIINKRIKSNKTEFEIIKDGWNGLKINDFNIYWGSDKKSPIVMRQYTLDNPPEKGGLDDVISAINNSKLVNDIVRAEKQDGKLHLIQLTTEDLYIENITNNKDANYTRNNITELGLNLPKERDKCSYIMYKNSLCLENTIPEKKGYLMLNNDKIYYSNIKNMGKSIYRISGFNIDKEYKADDSFILSLLPIQIKDFTIHQEDYFVEEYDEDNNIQEYTKKKNYVVLKTKPTPHDIITVINRS